MEFLINRFKKNSDLYLPFLVGILAFIIVSGGGKIIWPTNIKWLFEDNLQALIAWQFFRHTPLFQSPLGVNYPYGMGLSGSIIYADPLVIFAFPFKLFSKILPTEFQYAGLWVFVCFILQTLFSWKLLKKITHNQTLLLIGSLFFVLSPVFLFRILGSVSFLGQWLILAGIFLYFSLSFRGYAWCTLLVASSLIHPYFLFMLLALWGADLIRRTIFFELTYLKLIKSTFLTLLILLVIMWQVGYFLLQSGYEGPGLGLYRTNLLSFINPFYANWSYILPLSPHTAGDNEGFSYLGLGMIMLGLLGLAGLLALSDQRRKLIVVNTKKIIPLMAITLFLMVLALSNRIVIGQYEWIQYKLPDFLGIFRATGRMALPFYYLIYIGVFYLIVNCYKQKTAVTLVLICLVIQITDSSQEFIKLRHEVNLPHYYSTLKSPVWSKIAKKYKKVILFLPESHPSDWKTLTSYAAFNALSINAGYFARVDYEKLKKNRELLLNEILQGQLDKDSVYLVKDERLRQIITHVKMNLPYKVLNIDGYFLLLPGWAESSTKAEQWHWAKGTIYPLGTRISFQKPGDNFKNYIISVGWSFAEGLGTWTEGDNAMVFLNLSQKTDSDLMLTIEGMPYINVKHPRLDVEVVVNQRSLGYFNYTLGNFSTAKQITIPKSVINRNNFLLLQFKFKNAISPKALNLSPDVRELGLFFSSLRVAKKG